MNRKGIILAGGRGIHAEQLSRLAEPMKNMAYGQYLIRQARLSQ
jgi:hypothetical protein